MDILNQTVIVGRIVRDPELRETETGNKITNITLAVPRSFKNVNGEYETDFISCVLWKGVAENVVEYCKKGDLVGVKGHIQTRNIEMDDSKRQVMEVVAEKVTFLSSKKEEKYFFFFIYSYLYKDIYLITINYQLTQS